MRYVCCGCDDSNALKRWECRIHYPCHEVVIRHTDTCLRYAVETKTGFCISDCGLIRRGNNVIE